jgi:hypothetical protein
MNILYYGFYKIAVYLEKNWIAPLRIPQWIAIIFLTIFLFINILTGMSFYTAFTGNVPNFPDYFALIFGFSLYLVFYFIYLKNNRYLKIIEAIDNSNSNARIVKIIVFILYVILSISLLPISFSI